MRKTLEQLRKASYTAAATVQVNAYQLVESRRNRLGAGGAVLFGLLAAATPALAQGGRCLKGGQGRAAGALADFISGAAKFLVYIAGFIAVLMIIVGGIQFMAGTKGSAVARGKEFVKNALIGLVVVVAAFLIKEVVVNLVAGISSDENTAHCLGEGKW